MVYQPFNANTILTEQLWYYLTHNLGGGDPVIYTFLKGIKKKPAH